MILATGTFLAWKQECMPIYGDPDADFFVFGPHLDDVALRFFPNDPAAANFSRWKRALWH